MPTIKPAQAVELIALGVCQAVGIIRKSHGFLPSAGTPVANGLIIAALLQASHLPSKIAVVHCSAHTKESDAISLGNNRADRAAKYATQMDPPYPFSTQSLNLALSLIDIINYQAKAPQSKKDKWIQKVPNNYQIDYTLVQTDFLYSFSFDFLACT